MVHVQVDDCAFQIEICNSQNIPYKEYPIPADPASDPEGSQKYQYHACPYKANQPHQHVYIESPPSNLPQTYHINIEPFHFFRYNKCYGFYFFPSFDGVSPSYGKKLTKQTIQRVKFDMMAKGRVLDGSTSATLAYLKERETETHLVQFNASGEGTIRIAWVEIEDPNLKKAVADSSTSSKRNLASSQIKEGMPGRSTPTLYSDNDDRSDGSCWKSKARQLIDNMDAKLRATLQTSINEYNHNHGFTSATEAEMGSGTITPPDEFTGSLSTTRASTPLINPKPCERPKLMRRESSHLRAWITKKIGRLDLSCRCVREERKAKENLVEKERQATSVEELSCDTPNTTTSGETTTADTTPTSKKTKLEDIAEYTVNEEKTNLSFGDIAAAQPTLDLEKTAVVSREETFEDAKKATKDVKKSKEELGLPRTYQLRSITFHYRTKEQLQALGVIPRETPRPRPVRGFPTYGSSKSLNLDPADAIPLTAATNKIAGINRAGLDPIQTDGSENLIDGHSKDQEPFKRWIWETDADDLHTGFFTRGGRFGDGA